MRHSTTQNLHAGEARRFTYNHKTATMLLAATPQSSAIFPALSRGREAFRGVVRAVVLYARLCPSFHLTVSTSVG